MSAEPLKQKAGVMKSAEEIQTKQTILPLPIMRNKCLCACFGETDMVGMFPSLWILEFI